ncbi:MAG: ribonuclease III [Myxococcales bacterium]|nr:ribonuclease III [Myxococcales bacterium]
MRLGHAFAQPELLAQALTHSSAVNEQGGSSNERLEFLGDAVLGLVVAQRLFSQFPGAPEGVLSRLRASVINEAALAAVARGLGLGAQLVLGRGEERDGGRDKDALLADAVEALFGAVYLDAGMAAATTMIERLLAASLAALSAASTRDAKTQLQERVQASERCTPAYELVSQEGPPHARVFVVAVSWHGREHGRGAGKSKKAAEHAAAIAALATLT